ncbi:hypothetical protein LCGC14_1189700 [marine sediment metagenome]|uniref:Uncharacterized protein n=1 Tax=marine sediment metagenome TaxID=412755 RepID=A0A0F9LJZ3_9ZZZZ
MTTPTDTPEEVEASRDFQDFQDHVDEELTDEQREWLTGEEQVKTEEAEQ